MIWILKIYKKRDKENKTTTKYTKNRNALLSVAFDDFWYWQVG